MASSSSGDSSCQTVSDGCFFQRGLHKRLLFAADPAEFRAPEVSPP